MTQAALDAARTRDDSELSALAELAADGFGGAVTRVQELHEAVADRSFGPTRAASGAPRAVHDAIAGSVYAAVRGAGALVGAGLARGVRASGGGPRISDHPRGRLAQGALNGLWGDRLTEADSALAVPMAIRVGGRDVAAGRDALAAAFPEATARPVVFVHGLCESDAAWAIRAAERDGTYFTRVLPAVGGTAVVLRYNSGLHVSENGRRLATLLEALVDGWPVPVQRLALVGHSMGGLVVRSAGHAGTERGDRWPSLVDTTVSLGAPTVIAGCSPSTARLRSLPARVLHSSLSPSPSPGVIPRDCRPAPQDTAPAGASAAMGGAGRDRAVHHPAAARRRRHAGLRAALDR